MVIQLLLIFVFIFGAVALLGYALAPLFESLFRKYHEKKVDAATQDLEEMFIWVERKRLLIFFAVSPLVSGIVTFVVFGQPIMIIAGVLVGFALPSIAIKLLERARKQKFSNQLLDALLIISQSLKAGLSFLQALEVLVEQMPAPLSQEFSLLVKRNKMGMPLETAFEKLNQKMQIEELNLLITAMLVARETGGNLSDVLAHLSDTIVQRRRLVDKVVTLTTQIRWQAVIVSLIPVLFAFFIYKMNNHYFDVMLQTTTGKGLLLWCVFSEIVGVALLVRLSKVEI